MIYINVYEYMCIEYIYLCIICEYMQDIYNLKFLDYIGSCYIMSVKIDPLYIYT